MFSGDSSEILWGRIHVTFSDFQLNEELNEVSCMNKCILNMYVNLCIKYMWCFYHWCETIYAKNLIFIKYVVLNVCSLNLKSLFLNFSCTLYIGFYLNNFLYVIFLYGISDILFFCIIMKNKNFYINVHFNKSSFHWNLKYI